ncbi:hypothetical protein [Agrobacterium vitis]|uniref:hypothetical protein n=1 Tax=Agrobacterium vitis TaxID=373 RepID=UPI001F412633|nr:hypothetical protein [Agrobacterium vitis]
MLKFDTAWRFSSPGPAPATLSRAFYDFIEKIASQGNTWGIVERFKEAFGGSGTSSSLSWAWSDLDSAMRRAEENAPLFIEAFYTVCMECADDGLGVPDVAIITVCLRNMARAIGSNRPIWSPQTRRPRRFPCRTPRRPSTRRRGR